MRVFIPAFLYDSNQCCYYIDIHDSNIGPEYATYKIQRMEILRRGPQWSHIIKYCIRDRKCQTKLVPDVPGHAAILDEENYK